MDSFQAISTFLRFIGENIAQFSGGLFSGATIYICLTERPPRTTLSFADLLALSRANARRTNTLLAILAGFTGASALLCFLFGGGMHWLAGGVAHLVAVALLFSTLPRIARGLRELSSEKEAEPEGVKLMNRQTAYLSALCLIGLFSQYLFVVQPF